MTSDHANHRYGTYQSPVRLKLMNCFVYIGSGPATIRVCSSEPLRLAEVPTKDPKTSKTVSLFMFSLVSKKSKISKLWKCSQLFSNLRGLKMYWAVILVLDFLKLDIHRAK